MPEVFDSLKDFGGELRRRLAILKPTASTLARQLGAAREKAKVVAPKFVLLFDDMKADFNRRHGGTSSFTVADFARLFDPTVPTRADDKDGAIGYRNHAMYYGINYMLTLRRNANRAGTAGTTKRDPAKDQTARFIATILQVAKDPAVVWSAVSREFGLTPRLLAMWQTRVAAAKPIIDFSAVLKPVNVDESKIVHMTPQVMATTQPMTDASAADIKRALEQGARAVGVGRGRRPRQSVGDTGTRPRGRQAAALARAS